MSERSAHRRTWDALLPLLMGLLLGVLSSFAAFNGRLTALETSTASDGKRLEKLEVLETTINERLAEISASVATITAVQRSGAK